MTKWVDQKTIEMRIIACNAWQDVLDELEKPNSHFTPRHATTILKGIANKYCEIEKEAFVTVGDLQLPRISSEEIIEVACQEAAETIRRKASKTPLQTAP